MYWQAARRAAEYPVRPRCVKCTPYPVSMRVSLIFFMLILLPVATGVHAWLFCRDNLPALTQEAVRRLKDAGVRDPIVDIEFFDIAVRGDADDPVQYQKALASIRNMSPLRLKPEAVRIHVKARLKAVLDGDTLRISGWLPEEGGETEKIRHLVAELRPDLKIDTQGLRQAPEVTWPEGLKPPLTASSPLLKPILERLRVPAELHVRAKDDAITLAGLLPAAGLKEELVAALTEVAGARVVDPSALKASSHVMAAAFAKPEALAAFLRSFFKGAPPRSFDIDASGVPHLEGLATRQSESEWLALLRPLTGGARVHARLTLVPSELHAPGYKPRSVLPSASLESVRAALHQTCVSFEAGVTRLTPEEQTKLAALSSLLLSAGPSLGLVIGAHPDPGAPTGVEQSVGKARAEAVLSFLIEQGVPSTDISAVVFDPVPVGSPFAPSTPRCVEILIK